MLFFRVFMDQGVVERTRLILLQYRWFIAGILTFAFLNLASAWAQPVGERIIDVQYQLDGKPVNDGPTLESIRRQMPLRLIGKSASRRLIRNSIESLYKTGNYSYVQAVAIATTGGLIVRFDLTSRVRIQNIQLTGSAIDDKVLLPLLKSQPGQEYVPQIAETDGNTILQIHRNHGYFKASVKLKTTFASETDRQVTVNFPVIPGERTRVTDIRLEGAVSVKAKTLRQSLSLKQGDVYQLSQIETDAKRLRRIYQREGYLNAQVQPTSQYNAQTNRITIIYQITEDKRVKIEVQGEDIKKEDVESIVLNQDAYSDSTLKNAQLQIQRRYQQKGYPDPTVQYEVTEDSEKEVTVRFIIDLGQSLRVQHVEFQGNRAFDAGTLRKQIQLRPPSRFRLPGLGWLFSEGLFDELQLEVDRKALELFYQKAGYLDVRAQASTEVTDENRIVVHFSVEEGEQRWIQQVRLEGNTVFRDEAIRDGFSLNPGHAYSPDLATRDLLYLRSLYDSRGYIYASFESSYVRSTGTLNYQISEGPQVRVGAFHVHGARHLKEEVLTRELEDAGMQEGGVFDPDKLSTAQQRLFALGLFRTVYLETPERYSQKMAEKLDIHIRVEPRNAGSISLSGGYSPSEGYRGAIELTHRNVFQRNMRATVHTTVGTKGNVYETSLTVPWLKLPLIGRTTAVLGLSEDNLEEFDNTRARSGTFDLRKKLGRFSDLGLQYKYLDLTQQLPDQPTIQTTVSSLGISWRLDSRDSILTPTRGKVNEIALEYAGGFLGGETSFLKLTTDHRYYRPLGPTILVNAIRLGFEEGLRSNREQEIIGFERFRAGGSTSVRGYRERSLGPLDSFGNHRGDVLVLVNTELRIPIYGLLGTGLFFDTGNVWNALSDIDTSPLHSSAGAGIRIETPLGPVRFDVAVPLRKGFDSPMYWLELGHAF